MSRKHENDGIVDLRESIDKTIELVEDLMYDIKDTGKNRLK
ncbi:hypothetical protein PCC7424_3235 [Gloeothece citriformis PCC 7424]|uniref:Uncharacterized protein n=1 Tax=Gloeothece citriformis (strain PCC 7424) TaxID=65393 RepID=B7KCT4_GLOC7|nr:hypothetical protein [Gloeothece citriformis]ACK71635.1 hypothetical protein PCC7424_3235 [Gloeothece citriformis PCC 7424]